MAAANVGDLCAALKLRNNPIQCREPRADQIVVVAGSEEPSDRAEETGCMVAPRHPTTSLEDGLDLILAVNHRGHQVKGSHHEDGAFFDGEYRRLLWRQGEFLRGAVIGQVIRRRLM